MLARTSHIFLETPDNEKSVVRDPFCHSTGRGITGMHRNDTPLQRGVPANCDQVWQLVRRAGSGPQAFGSTVKQTDKEEELQLPLTIVFPGRMDT